MAEEDEYGMVAKNASKGGEAALLEPKEILGKIGKLDGEIKSLLSEIKSLIK